MEIYNSSENTQSDKSDAKLDDNLNCVSFSITPMELLKKNDFGVSDVINENNLLFSPTITQSESENNINLEDFQNSFNTLVNKVSELEIKIINLENVIKNYSKNIQDQLCSIYDEAIDKLVSNKLDEIDIKFKNLQKINKNY